MTSEEKANTNAVELEYPLPATIELPRDQYRHPDAPTEWWWHIGTLKSKDGSRTYGFEINAAVMMADKKPFGPLGPFAQMELTDLTNKINYRCTEFYPNELKSWAETDQEKPWNVMLYNGVLCKTNSVVMREIDGSPMDMSVTASFTDANRNNPGVESNSSGNAKKIVISLVLQNANRKAPYALMEGGSDALMKPAGPINKEPPNPYNCYNYYYSLTNLAASGTICIGDDKPVLVEGTTWMDHQYGYFPPGKKATWYFNAVQMKLPSGEFHFSNFTVAKLEEGKTVDSTISALNVATGKTHSWKTKFTPSDPFVYEYKPEDKLGPTQQLVFYRAGVISNIDAGGMLPGDDLSIHIQSSFDDQVFMGPVFEGVATAELYVGKNKFEAASSTAWIEQRFVQKPTPTTT